MSTVMRMVGTALLWVALAALIYVPTSGDSVTGTIAAVTGFAAFALGLALFADGLKRDIVAEIQKSR